MPALTRHSYAHRPRRFHSWQRAASVATLGLLLSGCLSTHLPPISASGENFRPLPDEVQLWDDATAEEDLLREGAYFYGDPLLESYLLQIVDRLTTPGMAANPELSFHVTVLEEPTLNAFAYPHGALYVHTGLLARMENEAQLATVLSHEMSHVEQRHMVRYRRTVHNRQIGWTAAAIAAALVIANEAGDAFDDGDWGKAARIGILGDLLVSFGLELALIASVKGYGRDLEREADMGAFNRLERAGYDPREAAAVFQHLQQGSPEQGNLEVFFFGSHPQLSRRIENAQQWSATNGHGDSDEPSETDTRGLFPLGEDLFWQRILPVIRDDAGLNISYGRLALAETQLAKALDGLPDDPVVHYLFASLRRAQAEDDNPQSALLLDEARLALREAIHLDPDYAEAHRDLGLLSYDADDFPTACLAFYHYGSLAPDADDAAEIDRYLQDLKADDLCR